MIKLRHHGFTIIEVLLVLAIAGMIILLVFIVVPMLQRNERNWSRKHAVEQTAAAMEEFKGVYNYYPATPADAAQFINNNPEITRLYELTFRPTESSHDYWPPEDSIAIHYGHWCNTYGDGDDPGHPIAGNHSNTSFYAIWTILEPDAPDKRNVFCIDNYDGAV